MNPTLKKFASRALWALAAVVMTCAAFFCAVVQPGGSGVVQYCVAGCSEYMVIQPQS